MSEAKVTFAEVEATVGYVKEILQTQDLLIEQVAAIKEQLSTMRTSIEANRPVGHDVSALAETWGVSRGEQATMADRIERLEREMVNISGAMAASALQHPKSLVKPRKGGRPVVEVVQSTAQVAVARPEDR